MSKPFPQDRINRIRRLTETHGIETAAEIARTSSNAIRAIRKRGWTMGKEGPAVRPMPSDYAIQSAAMTIPEMAVYYSAGRSTLQRWSAEIGRKKMHARRKRA